MSRSTQAPSRAALQAWPEVRAHCAQHRAAEQDQPRGTGKGDAQGWQVASNGHRARQWWGQEQSPLPTRLTGRGRTYQRRVNSKIGIYRISSVFSAGCNHANKNEDPTAKHLAGHVFQTGKNRNVAVEPGRVFSGDCPEKMRAVALCFTLETLPPPLSAWSGVTKRHESLEMKQPAAGWLQMPS